MALGRPRTRCPDDEKLIELGEDLVKWASETLPPGSKEIRCRFCQWYSLKQGLLAKEWEYMVIKPVFSVYYEKARTLLAQKYIDGSINASIAHRFLRIYFPEVKKDENEKLEQEAKLKAQENAQVTEEIKKQYELTLNQLSLLQSQRKIADNSNSDAAKSELVGNENNA